MSDLAKQLIEKTSYMNDVKQAIKRAIQDKGQTIEDDLSFYSYADKIRQITAMEGVVKLFETEEEMYWDSTAKEGDLAVVYGQQTKNMASNDTPQYITFPETVTLPEPLQNSVNCTFESTDTSVMVDIQVLISISSFKLNCWSSYIDVEYTSSDGITYYRSTFKGTDGDLSNPVDLGVPIQIYNSNLWDDNIGYFMQIDSHYFGGLYEYQKGEDKDKLLYVSDICADDDSYGSSTSTTGYVTKEYINSEVFKNVLNKLPDNTVLDSLLVILHSTYDVDDDIDMECFAYTNPTRSANTFANTLYACNIFAYGDQKSSQSYVMFKAGYEANDTTDDFKMYKWTFKNGSTNCTMEEVTDFNTYVWQKSDMTSYNKLCYIEPINYQWYLYSIKYKNNKFEFYPLVAQPRNSYNEYDISMSFYEYEKYRIADNQYNLDNPNQLLPEVKAYGKNGNVTGDGSIYNSLNLDKLFVANNMDIYKDSLVALKESSTGNKIKDVEPFTDGVGFITSNSTINELFKNYQVIRSKSYIIAYNNTTINLYDLNYNLLQTGTNSRIKDLFLKSKLIYEDDNQVVHIGFSNNSYDGYCFLVDLSKDRIKITYVSLDFERIDLICYVGEDLDHNRYKYYVVSRNSLQSSSVRIEAFTTTDSGVGYSKTISNVSLTNKTNNNTSYCCFDDNYVYMTLPPYWRKFIVIDKSTDTIIKNNTSESSIYLCNNVGTCYMNTGGDTNSGVYELNGTSQEKISENKNIPTIFTGLYQYYYIPDYDCIITTMSGGDEVALSTSQGLNEICNFRSLLQPYYNGDMNKGGLNTTLYLNGTKLEGLAVLFPDHTDTDAKVFNISIDFTKTLSNEGDINTLPINNGYIGNLVISQMDNTNYSNTLTPEEYLQALQTAKEIKGNGEVVIDGVPFPTDNLNLLNELISNTDCLREGRKIEKAQSLVSYNPNIEIIYDSDNRLYDFGLIKDDGIDGGWLPVQSYGGYYFIMEKQLDINTRYRIMTSYGGLSGHIFDNTDCVEYKGKYLYFVMYGSYMNDFDHIEDYSKSIEVTRSID